MNNTEDNKPGSLGRMVGPLYEGNKCFNLFRNHFPVTFWIALNILLVQGGQVVAHGLKSSFPKEIPSQLPGISAKMFQIVRTIALPNVRLPFYAVEPRSKESTKLITSVSPLLMDVEFVGSESSKHPSADKGTNNSNWVWWEWHVGAFLIGFVIVFAIWPNIIISVNPGVKHKPPLPRFSPGIWLPIQRNGKLFLRRIRKVGRPGKSAGLSFAGLHRTGVKTN